MKIRFMSRIYEESMYELAGAVEPNILMNLPLPQVVHDHLAWDSGLEIAASVENKKERALHIDRHTSLIVSCCIKLERGPIVVLR